MDKYKDKYRIPSARLQGYDYGANGAYFITICTHQREEYFGNITQGKMTLNTAGQLAEKNWMEITNQFPFVELDAFVIMPNHMHGILIINKSAPAVETRFIASVSSPNASQSSPIASVSANADTEQNVQTRLIASLQNNGGITGGHNPMFHENISRIIRWYKGRCSFDIRKTNHLFEWQSRFHDHIIRDAQSFITICNYIETNPENWERDSLNPRLATAPTSNQQNPE